MTFRKQLHVLTSDLGVSHAALLLIGIASVVAGGIEAAVLAIVMQVAASIASDHIASVHLGQLSLEHLSVSFLIAVGLGLAVARFALQFVLAWLPARVSTETQAAIQKRVLGAFLNATWAAQATDKEGHLQETAITHAEFALWAVRYMCNATSAALRLVTLAVFALLLNPLAAMALIALAAVLFTLLHPLARRARQLASEQSAASLYLAQGVSETVRVAEAVQTYAVEESTLRRLLLRVEGLSSPTFRAQFLWQFVPGAYQTLAVVFLLAGLGALNGLGTQDLGSLGALVLILVRCLAYGQQFQSTYHQVSDLWVNVDLALETEWRFAERARRQSSKSLPAIESLAFDGVSYSYGTGPPVLQNLSFEIEPGEAIGIVGPSGAGKSTLVQVLLRLREPTEGHYLVNGQEAEEFSRPDWFARVAYLPQDPQLVTGSVRDNIRFFRLGIDEAAIEAAARAAGIHEEILGWAAGYETIIGQRADAVSGGQRQRLCLARALVGRPDILVLDEATAALDAHSEALVHQSLDSLKGRITLIIVAHRSSILGLCDRSITLAATRIMGVDDADCAERLSSVGSQRNGFRAHP